VRLALLFVVACGCGYSHLVTFDLDEGDHRELAGTDLVLGRASGMLEVRSISEQRVLDRHPADKTRFPLPLEGRSCEVNVPYGPHSGSLRIELVCSDGPPPGSANAATGNKIADWVPWALPQRDRRARRR
jgi:hypothetical protein